MKAKGTFDVTLDPFEDEHAPAGRMVINKTYRGGLEGTGTGQMLSKRTAEGVAVYSAIEEFVGSVDGQSGSFTLSHHGFMSQEKQTLTIEIIPSSGSAGLATITGSLEINQQDGQHSYVLTYDV